MNAQAMSYYAVKVPIYGIESVPCVERFSAWAAERHLADNPAALEPYDEKKHGKLRGAADARAAIDGQAQLAEVNALRSKQRKADLAERDEREAELAKQETAAMRDPESASKRAPQRAA